MGVWIMSSIALIDRRCVRASAAALLADRVAHTQIIDEEEQGLKVLDGLLSAYPAVEFLHIMVYVDPVGDCQLGHSIMTPQLIADHHLPVCDEMTIVVYSASPETDADIEALCASLQKSTGAIVLNNQTACALHGYKSADLQKPFS
jgi:hypothetical protein